MSETIVTLKKGEGRTVKAGGLWIYDNEIDTIAGSFKNGTIVTVRDFDGYPMGKGFINQNSKIRIRLLTRQAQTQIDDAFLLMRVQNAWDYRKNVMTSREDLSSCRVIFGEADWLPGLVVDKYEDILVVESLALGMELLKETILKKLVECMEQDGFSVRGIYERSDAPVRKKEGLMPHKGFLYAADAPAPEEGFFNYGEFATDVEIVENGVHYMVDVVNGQKTGFFLDQKYNRRAMQHLCKGKKVLDCFTHMGTFALNAGIAGAADVTGLDISEYAVKQATENAARNGLSDTVHFRQANVLDELPKLAESGEQYDVVILDPPAFTKSREATKNAIKGYREINRNGLKLVKDGGYFATCSCSHFMTQELFTKVIGQAALSAHKRLRQIEFRTQAPDHPILWSADESYYLKFFIFQVCEEK
ncbi:MAG: class I SAM-dependent rRNA methyltransferase [Lachnospiraceae bacterium]|nr:class I SAM-dependent rRNA methyltransferase [Lachnospiraceae bacterium]